MSRLRFLPLILLLLSPLVYAGGPADVLPRPVYARSENGICRHSTPKIRIDRKAFARQYQGPAEAMEEAYHLLVTRKGVRIEAAGDAGVFRAMTTLRQMQDAPGPLQCCEIRDYPRFPHRGLMIDESRSFKGKEFLLKQIDAMALLKLNVLHLHLTDAAGWRLEVSSAPKLSENAAWRIGKLYYDWEKAGYPFTTAEDPEAYGGYYSAADIREIVAYAAARYITVIPEIEMPGHSMEVNRMYPELSCLKEDGRHSPFSWDLCPGNEGTFRLLEGILDEVIDLFPSPYIHIGGDEAVMRDWPLCVNCRRRMEEEGMQDVHELQAYLIRRMTAYIESKGRRVIGWDELLETGVPESATIQSWRGIKGGIRAVAQGHDVVMSPTSHCYFDYYQDLIRKEPKAVGYLNSLRHCYSYNPVWEGLSAEEARHIRGVQANLWCELIPSVEHAEYMLYPRLFAIAEIGWTPQELRSYADFYPRARALSAQLRERGYNSFDLDSESERARSNVFHQVEWGGLNVISHDYGSGPILSFKESDGVQLLCVGDLGFKDMNGNGSLDPFEDWRLSAEQRADDLLSREESLRPAACRTLERSALIAYIQNGSLDNPYGIRLETL